MPYNSFDHRQPTFRSYARKPSPNIPPQLNPSGQLRPGLVMAILADNVHPTNYLGLHDYAAPNRRFTLTSPAYTVGNSGYGRTIYGTAATTSNILLSPTLTLPSTCTISMMVVPSSTSTTLPFMADSANDWIVSLSSTTWAFDNVALTGATRQTGPHRITIVRTSSTAATGYINGVPGSVITTSITFGAVFCIWGGQTGSNAWPHPTIDCFVWNYAFTADRVAMHAANPYGGIFLPDYSEIEIGPGLPPAVYTASEPIQIWSS